MIMRPEKASVVNGNSMSKNSNVNIRGKYTLNVHVKHNIWSRCQNGLSELGCVSERLFPVSFICSFQEPYQAMTYRIFQSWHKFLLSIADCVPLKSFPVVHTICSCFEKALYIPRVHKIHTDSKFKYVLSEHNYFFFYQKLLINEYLFFFV